LPQTGNELEVTSVYSRMPGSAKYVIWLLSVALLSATAGEYTTAKRKLDLIDSDRLRPGSRLDLTLAELNAYAAGEAPAGVRDTRLRIPAPGQAVGSATVDFLKLRRAQGARPGWLMSKLLDGERPVSVSARLHSSGGYATVDVDEVTISGVTIDGRTLDFLIQDILLPLYPDATVGRPFELGHRIQSVDLTPAGVTVRMKP
jgi:hypothetical protein